MQSGKERAVTKNTEMEALSTARTEIPAESDTKDEPMARKRWWISN